MKIIVLQDPSGTGKFKIGDKVEAVISAKMDQAVAFDREESPCYWSFFQGQFAPAESVEGKQAEVAGSLAAVIGAKPAKITIEM